MSDSVLFRERAVRRLLRLVQPTEPERVPPHMGIGRTAVHNITAFCDVPEHPCSVRDGYALRTEDIEQAHSMRPARLVVTQTVRAESRQANPVLPGEAARVLTGGMIPPGADAVLAEEDVEIVEVAGRETIVVLNPVRKGWFVRPAGAEIGLGAVITRAGEIITPQAAAVMVRTRSEFVQVHPLPRARVISLGSELSDPTSGDKPASVTRFPADNLVLASGLLTKSGVDVVEACVLPDSEDQLVEALSRNDLPEIVITTGGTGRSERDFARIGARDAGFTMIFEGMDIRPGRNMFAAQKGNTILFGLPGPPAAVFACFHAAILPVIRRLRGLAERTKPFMARLEDGISARPEGDWIILCSFKWEGATLVATPLIGRETPSMLAIGLADGVAVIGDGNAVLPGGEIEIFSTLFE